MLYNLILIMAKKKKKKKSQNHSCVNLYTSHELIYKYVVDFDMGKGMSLASSTHIGFKKTEKRRNIYLMLTLPRNPINIQNIKFIFGTITI